MFNAFAFILAIIITLILLVPFGFLMIYAIIAIRQLAIGSKESSSYKKRSAQRTLLLTIPGMLLLLFIWLAMLQRIP